MNECYICTGHFLVTDVIEGTLICTDCGTVQETNLNWCDIHCRDDNENDILHPKNELNHIEPSFNKMCNSNNIMCNSIMCNSIMCNSIMCNSIPDICWKEATTMMNTLPKKYRGKIKKGVYANCIHKVCAMHHIPRSIKEISEILHIDMETINKTNRTLNTQQEFIQYCTQSEDSTQSFCKMLTRYIDKLQCHIHIEKKHRLINTLQEYLSDEKILEGRTPHTKIITLLYHLLQRHKQQNMNKKDLCNLFEISTVTLNKSYKQLLQNLSNLRTR